MYSQLQAWLTQNIPEIDRDLNAGVSEAELDQFAKQIGAELPSEFLELYRWHDGQDRKGNTGLFYGLMFLSLEESQRNWKVWSDLIDSETDEGLRDLGYFAKSAKPKTVKPVYANKLWIPFADDRGGNHLGIDLDPDEAGTRGQVINFGRDEDTKYVIATDVSSFVRWMLRELESGNFFIEDQRDGVRSFNTLHPRTHHFLASVRILFDESPTPKKKARDTDRVQSVQNMSDQQLLDDGWKLDRSFDAEDSDIDNEFKRAMAHALSIEDREVGLRGKVIDDRNFWEVWAKNLTKA